MKQTIDTGIDLMSQRFKLIADYPTNTLTVGTVINNEAYFHICVQYPHLFKKLEWWEERDKSEMPKYVKYREGYHKVEFAQKIGGEMWLKIDGIERRINAFYTDPSSEAEYQNYLKSKS